MIGLKSRIIFPLEEEEDLTVSKYKSRTYRLAHYCIRQIAYFLRIRIRVTNNITTSILTALFPFIGIFLFLLVLLTRDSQHGGILPVSRAPPKIREINPSIDKPFALGCVEPDVDAPRANAVLVILARNKELVGVRESMMSLERHFNRWFHYPYVFLNDEEFDQEFRKGVSNITDSDVQFGVIEPEDWNFPEWADQEEIDEGIARQGDDAIMYGGMESYHHMCRFYSGKFYNHKLLKPYDWYWRVEPEVKYFCDITYDPFIHMQRNNKVYGFTIFIKELVETVPNLFRYTAGYKHRMNINTTKSWDLFLKKPELEEFQDVTKDSGSVRKAKIQKMKEEKAKKEEELRAMMEELPEEVVLMDLPNSEADEPVSEDAMEKESYNMCHFWSNFEIARLDFFRSKEYNDYFDAMDKSGGFWYERWGDAPIHSLAAGLFLEPEQIHYFRDIGYRHTTIQHCPANAPERQLKRVPYIPDPTDPEGIEEDNYWAHYDPEVPNGVGCRCRCDTDVVDVEGKEGSCLNEWVDLIGGWI